MDTQRQNSTAMNHSIPKKSAYSDTHKIEASKLLTQNNHQSPDKQQQGGCEFESHPGHKQQPVCCTVCAIF